MRNAPYLLGGGLVLLLVWLRVRSKETMPHPGYTTSPTFMTNIQPNPGTVRGNIMAPGGGIYH